MGAAEAMEGEGHTMTPSRRAVLERFDALVEQVDVIEARQMMVIERIAGLEVNAAFAERLTLAGVAARLDRLEAKADRLLALLAPAVPG